MDNNSKLNKQSSETIEDGMKKIKKMIKEKFGIVIPKSDLPKLVTLTKELDKFTRSGETHFQTPHISEEKVIEFQQLMKKTHGKDISLTEAREGASSVITLVAYKEKERLRNEIRAIFISNKEIPIDEAVSLKTANFFQSQYGIVLTANQLEQIVPYLTRQLWYQEGLDASLLECLEGLTIYADKVKRGKRTNGLNTYKEVRKAFDQAAQKLDVKVDESKLLYKESTQN